MKLWKYQVSWSNIQLAVIGWISGVCLSAHCAETTSDIVIYGSSPAAISAAVQAKRMGKSAVIVSPESRIGGLTTGGLGQTDIGNKSAFGGIALEFYRDVAKWYADPAHWTRQTPDKYRPGGQTAGTMGADSMWTFEPSAALAILEGWEKRDELDIRRGEWLDREKGVEKQDGRIVAIKTLSGNVYRGKVFIDATYEGDLMAAAGVSYAVGREANSVYGETISGIQFREAKGHQLKWHVSAYREEGNPESGLLPGVEPRNPAEKDGDGDKRVQAYNFRMCLTDDPENRIPFKKPANYDEREYELLFRNFAKGENAVPWINSKMPNRKTDTNNNRGLSTDFIGRNYEWPEASYERRAEIFRAHLDYQRGLMWTLANHPRVPEKIRAEVSRWGTGEDEFLDGPGDGWQSQLYVREARRMVGEYVMTEHECRGDRAAPRPVAMGAYTMDSHNVRRVVTARGNVQNEGNIEDGRRYSAWGPDAAKRAKGGKMKPYGIDYGAITPKRGECANLLVPVCLSASHMAFGSIRMEPVFFALGQAAGTAASMSVANGAPVQDVPYAELRERLLADGQVISLEKSASAPIPAPREMTLVNSAVSPDGKNEIRLYSNPLAYEVMRDGIVVVAKTEIGLKMNGKCVKEGVTKLCAVRPAKFSGFAPTSVYKKGKLDLSGNETLIDFGDWAVRLAARNDGVAYRFETKKSGIVDCEKADLMIPKNARCWFNRTPRKMLGCEETVPQFADASALKTDERWAYYLPFVYSCGGTTVAVTESDVADYPVWNFGDVRETVAGVLLSSLFAKYPKATELSEGGARKRKIAVKGEEDFIAKASAPRPLPWRVFALADAPSKLCETDIAYALARPADGDFSWVRPGKVAWDWWNDFDNKGGAGCSTEGYVRFIDFAASNGVEYVIFDEGWSANLDIWKFSPKVDVPYLVDYANKKGVGIILWMAWAQVYGDEERVAEHFAKLGAKGFKVDFMDRGDAEVAEFMEKFAAACAKRHMLVDYHGAYRPAGLHRTYPNILNYEGIHGLEQMKWSRKNKDMPYNDVAAFFLRMTAGPMDYTPGAMDNYPIGDYRGNGRNPGSVGTRAHQMALMALYEAPLQMLADSPTKYEKNMECFSFMAKTPVVWDATIGLGGCPESYAAAARKAKDGAWYAAAISNRDARDITIPTDFLGDGEWMAEIFRDADDADKEPTHYVHEFKRTKAGERLTFRVAPGGGFVVRFDRPPCGCANLPPFVALTKSVYAPTDDNVSPSAALALPGVTLADLDGACIGCRFRGIHIANKGGRGKGCNVRRTPDGKGLRIEFQIHDDKYIKCVLVDLTDGEGGVWARKVGTSYRGASRSVKVGCHFGDVTRNDGYEVYGLFAAPSEPKPLPVIPQPAEWKPSAGECDLASAKVEVKVDASSGLGEEGYTMKIAPDAITVVAGGATGAVWARRTLAQLKAHGAASQCGEMRDVPKYRVRSFMMDVGRMHHSMDFMYDLARTMSYYKMNVLHVHLNDNAGGKDPNKYAAFRLESETYPELTAKDGHYTKKEFRDFMLFCKSIGVTVVPEIDVPAHSLAFTRVRPDFASKKYGADHLDLDKSEEILAWLKPLFAEYMTGDEPTFIGPYVHVGTDEYNKAEAEKFRAFQDAMFKMVMEFGYKPWAWGSLDNAKGETSVVASRDIMIDVWNNRYYHPENALKAGYTIVNIPDKIVYLVPFAGYYNDYFDCKKIYETWDPRINWRYRVPDKYLPQLAGGKFALWNDLCGKKKDGTPYTEADNWDRIHPALQTFAQKMWRGGEGNPPWEHFAALADSLSEPAGVKSTHKAKLR